MSEHDYDDGLIHSHNWAADVNPLPVTGRAKVSHPRVADAAKLPTPSSVHHDDIVEAGRH